MFHSKTFGLLAFSGVKSETLGYGLRTTVNPSSGCSFLWNQQQKQNDAAFALMPSQLKVNRNWLRSGIFIVNFEHIFFVITFEHVIAGWVKYY